ncbi:hypothetical protein EIN_335430 [Entamoeba invadens IP1]|uniref:Uncharacterized protein n=1 Tax=Entamoeba invadens IP1 TaxID=370355 RepID=L7FM87_ENTIV|nr:hypothetical protein EIN_335430 [Entamoeba invadens IP1]ELP88561.1 hypothetical protein EIN_335430 [Entamoeba invadens IP1]|eukprot:XP_004255332.1 hypothetical protein EIN_335430 [Entamoeba invadens IP1]
MEETELNNAKTTEPRETISLINDKITFSTYIDVTPDFWLVFGDTTIAFVGRRLCANTGKSTMVSVSERISNMEYSTAKYCTSDCRAVVFSPVSVECYIFQENHLDLVWSASQTNFSSIGLGKFQDSAIYGDTLRVITDEGVLAVFDFTNTSLLFQKKVADIGKIKIASGDDKTICLIEENLNAICLRVDAEHDEYQVLRNFNIKRRVTILLKEGSDFLQDVHVVSTRDGFVMYDDVDLIEYDMVTDVMHSYSGVCNVVYVKVDSDFLYCGSRGGEFTVIDRRTRNVAQNLKLKTEANNAIVEYKLNEDNNILYFSDKKMMYAFNDFKMYLPLGPEKMEES